MQSTPFVSSSGETRNPIYEGQFDGETLEQAGARRHWAKVAMEMATDVAANSVKAKPVASVLPPMDEHLIYILGRPNFMCHGPAKSLRKLGHEIDHKSEHEQAHVIHWLLNSYLQHGADWLGACNSEIAAIHAK